MFGLLTRIAWKTLIRFLKHILSRWLVNVTGLKINGYLGDVAMQSVEKFILLRFYQSALTFLYTSFHANKWQIFGRRKCQKPNVRLYLLLV